MTYPHIEPPTLAYTEVAERYEQSTRFVIDALDHVATYGDRHAAYCELAMDLYRDSSQFLTMVDDIADGVVEL